MRSRHSRNRSLPQATHRAAAALFSLLMAAGLGAVAQAPQAQAPSSKHKPHAASPETPDEKPVSEEEMRQRLQGKTFYLRGRYSSNDLRFDIHGALEGSSPPTSYTLSIIQVEKVRLSKRQLQIEGIRYGMHFLGADATEDPTTVSEKLRITPKKKVVKIVVQREESTGRKKKSKNPEKPSSPVISQAAANRMFRESLDRIFAPELDEKMIASLPDYWQSYYRDAAAKSNFKPSDPSVLHQSMVDQKARLLSNFEPPSNDFAQNAGIVGVAQYHVVVGRDGKAGQIAVGRPIGFGLDENAVASIRKASFQPAMKDGKPVPVVLDLLVEFRIYSKRTGAGAGNEPATATVSEPDKPALPGPYSVSQPTAKQP